MSRCHIGNLRFGLVCWLGVPVVVVVVGVVPGGVMALAGEGVIGVVGGVIVVVVVSGVVVEVAFAALEVVVGVVAVSSR